MKVIIGLGNPGGKYDNTRHNVGFAVIDYLAAAHRGNPWRKKFQAEVCEVNEGGEGVLLVKPHTFMNLSGRAVREVVDFYKLTPEQLLVVCDDLALPLGKLRVRAGGSHGGQNGLRNIQEQLGTPEYPRLRVGIDPPGEHRDAVEHVLGRFRPSEQDRADEAIANAGRAALLWVSQGIEVCMNRTNGGPVGGSGSGSGGGEREKKKKAGDGNSPGASDGKN